jgi:hypothetical protein
MSKIEKKTISPDDWNHSHMETNLLVMGVRIGENLPKEWLKNNFRFFTLGMTL